MEGIQSRVCDGGDLLDVLRAAEVRGSLDCEPVVFAELEKRNLGVCALCRDGESRMIGGCFGEVLENADVRFLEKVADENCDAADIAGAEFCREAVHVGLAH